LRAARSDVRQKRPWYGTVVLVEKKKKQQRRERGRKGVFYDYGMGNNEFADSKKWAGGAYKGHLGGFKAF